MKKQLIIYLVCLCTLTSQAQLPAKNLAKYTSVNLGVNVGVEFPITIITTPLTSETVKNYVQTELNNASITNYWVNSSSSRPLIKVDIGDNGYDEYWNNCNEHEIAYSYFVELRVFETINGTEYITYQKLYNDVNLHGSSKTAGIWAKLRPMIESFIKDWKSVH
ncbi:MAG TPA: hypothetical protein PLP23_06565 [Panacibacter sp.]|nr:hypothetical protein [Panacibacter sp.]